MEQAETVTPVGYQGVPGAYSEEALVAFRPGVRPVPYPTLPELFAALDAGQITQAFVPIENSYAGSVVEAYDLMVQHDVTVTAEWIHPVHHFLLGLPGVEPSEVERVFSHPQALAQTAVFLQGANLTTEPYYDTAGAAQMVAERGDRRYAAVASRLAGERYGLSILAERIQSSADNATRFFLLEPGAWEPGREPATDQPGKTTLIFAVAHRPGALVRALSSFAQQQVNLVRLESRPSRERPWEYLFFTDLEGYASEPRIRTALREVTRLNPFVRVLGSYPRAATPPAEGS